VRHRFVTPGRIVGHKTDEILVGFDTHAEIDVVGIDFARAYSLKKAKATVLPIRGIGQHSPVTHGAWEVPLRLFDSRGRRRDFTRICTAVNQDPGDCPVLLGMPGLSDLGVVLSPHDSSWSFSLKATDIKLLKPRAFTREILQARRVFAVTATEVLFPTRQRGDDSAGPVESTGIPREFAAYQDVFEPDKADPLPLHSSADHSIDLLPGTQPPFGTIYPLSPRELEVLREYLKSALEKGWIRESKSPAGAPILFVPKSDGSLRLCVDYRGLNRISIKNRYPLPLIGEIMDRVQGARYFTKIDIKEAYHRLRIKAGDEWKTAFRTRYGHFEYCVLPFGLTNAPATFQSYIHQALHGLLDVVCIAYLDDVLIFSKTWEEHEKHVKEVLDRLREYKLYAHPKKCVFFQESVEFLGFIISSEGVAMDEKRVATIKEWPVPQTFHDIQVFLGFCNFYRRFIKKYSAKAAPLSNLLKGMQNGRKPGKVPWGILEQEAFVELKAAFLDAPLLHHFDPELPIRVETDASNFAMAGILSQLVDDGLWHPVAFWSRKFKGAEINYGTPDKELFAIVESFEEWRHYLDGASASIEVLTDHANLQGLARQPKLNSRQARWFLRLAPFEFEIKHRPGSLNPADGPSRRPDYEEGLAVEDLLPDLKRKLGVFQAVFCVGSVNPRGLPGDSTDPGEEISSPSPGDSTSTQWVRVAAALVVNHCRAPETGKQTGSRARSPRLDAAAARSKRQWGALPEQLIPALVAAAVVDSETPLAPEVSSDLRSLIRTLQDADLECQQAIAAAVAPQVLSDQEHWVVDHAGLLRKDGRVFVPKEATLRRAILKAYHEEATAGHFGKGRMLALLRRKFWWQGLAKEVEEFVRSCAVCQVNKSRKHKTYGQLQPLRVPSRPWQEISMDFITGLPPVFNGESEVDAILVVVDRLTKMTLFFPATTTLTASQLEELLYKEVWLKFGPPEGIVSDRGPVFTSQYWEEVCYLMQVKRRLSTAFHPQTDGQTERANQVLEQYLRCFIDENQLSWPPLLKTAEFAANNAINASTGKAPHELLMGYLPDFHLIDEDVSRGEGVPAAESRIRKLSTLREEAKNKLLHAQQQQKQYYDKKRMHREFAREDLVLLSTRNIRLRVPQKKLAPRFIGPFRVIERVGKQAYRLALPEQYSRLHDVFSVSLLEPWVPRQGDPVDSTVNMPMPALDEDPDVWEVEEVRGKKKVNSQIFYLVKWTGWPSEYNQWVAEEDMQAPDAIQRYEGQNQVKEKRRGRPKGAAR